MAAHPSENRLFPELERSALIIVDLDVSGLYLPKTIQ
jgi:hypothetical protein